MTKPTARRNHRWRQSEVMIVLKEAVAWDPVFDADLRVERDVDVVVWQEIGLHLRRKGMAA